MNNWFSVRKTNLLKIGLITLGIGFILLGLGAKGCLWWRDKDDDDVISGSSTPPPYSFARTWGGGVSDIANSIFLDSAGNIYLAGVTYSFGVGDGEVMLLKYDPNGNLLWSRIWGGSNYDGAWGTTLDSTGNIYLSSWTKSFGAGQWDVLLLKYDQNGVFLWARTWGGSSYDATNSITTDSDGNIYLAGYANNRNDVLLLKYDQDGTLVWARTWGESEVEDAYSLCLDSDGNIYVAGRTDSFGAGSYDTLLLKYDPDGTILWSRTWGGSGSEEIYSIGLDSDRNIYLAGYTTSFGAGDRDVLLLKYNQNGTFFWSKTWGGSELDRACSLTLDSTGNIYLSGRGTNSEGTWQEITIGTVTTPTGSSGIPSGTTGEPTGTMDSPTGTQTNPTGVQNTGGGFDDALLLKNY